MDVIDLRSDTVTRPSGAMRAAMAAADVGDDQFGEDPTVNRLQDRVATLLGKEAALWVPTGTMANQVGVLVFAFGPRTVRAVTHLDVSADDCERAATALIEAIEAAAA